MPRLPVSQSSWPGAFGTDFQRHVISAIVGGSPFARAVSPLPTNRTSVSFPLVNEVDDPSWLPELGEIPTLGIDAGEYDVAVSKLAGSVLISMESIDDTDFPTTAQTEQVLHDTFSAKLDRDLISGTGPAPAPTGVLAVASEVAAVDWELAAVKAKAEIATRGGTASHIAVSPNTLGELESARDTLGRALYPTASEDFAGLETVPAVSATQPIVFDWTRLFLVVRRDFSAELSPYASEAWNRYAQSLRIVGRFALACPMPAKSVRKLSVSDAPPLGAEPGGSGDEGRRPVRPGRGQGGAEPELQGQAPKRGK
jgi:HK97 family phage major capsid protein